jgi:hypothetical protein
MVYWLQVHRKGEENTMDAVVNLQTLTAFAARYALGQGVDRETVAQVLESLANAIRNPSDVAENMSPLTIDDI